MENNTDKKDFFRTVFYLEEDSKSQLINAFQFSFLSIIPVIILSKIIEKYAPKPDKNKSNLELFAEVVFHISALIVGVFFIIRIVTYFQTFTGIEYTSINELTILLSVILVFCTLDDILVEKIHLITGRLSDLWEGKSNDNTDKVVTRPPKTNPMIAVQPTTNTTPLNQLPPSIDSQATTQGLSQQLPDFSNNSSLPNNQDINHYINEPIAANDSIGGAFSSWH